MSIKRVWTARSVMALLVAGSIAAAFAGTFANPARAAFTAYSLGDLNGQNGWDGGIVAGNPVPFTNNNVGSDVVTNSDAFSGTQSWLYGGSYGSPGAGTPFTPAVATVGALNATAAGSPITPAGNKSVVSFAFKAVAPGDGSRINVYEGSHARDDRTGASLYLENDSANGNPAGTVSLFNFSSVNNPPACDTPQVILGSVAAGTWHTVEMTTVYPNLTVGNPSTYGSTTYVFDKGTLSQQTATMQSWAHSWRNCNGFNYTPGGSLKWSSSFNDYPTHQGFYIDDVSMKVINTATATTVGSFATSFEAVPIVSPLNAGTTSCDGFYNGTGKDVVVPAGATCTLVSGTHVTHDVNVQKGGTLIDQGATIDHDLSANQPAGVQVDGGSVGHDLSVNGVTGAPDGGDYVCNASVGHDLVVQNGAAAAGSGHGHHHHHGCGGSGSFEVGGNQVGHDLVVTDNAEPVDVFDNGTLAAPIGHDLKVQNNQPGGASVSGNNAGHDAVCKSNSPQDGSGNAAVHNNSCPV